MTVAARLYNPENSRLRALSENAAIDTKSTKLKLHAPNQTELETSKKPIVGSQKDHNERLPRETYHLNTGIGTQAGR